MKSSIVPWKKQYEMYKLTMAFLNKFINALAVEEFPEMEWKM